MTLGLIVSALFASSQSPAQPLVVPSRLRVPNAARSCQDGAARTFQPVCATGQGVSLKEMDFQECARAQTCRIRGTLDVRLVGHVEMGRLALGSGECINVSLPSGDVRRLRRQGSITVVVEGTVFPAPLGEEIADYRVNQRRIGLGQCANFFLYVPQIQPAR